MFWLEYTSLIGSAKVYNTRLIGSRRQVEKVVLTGSVAAATPSGPHKHHRHSNVCGWIRVCGWISDMMMMWSMVRLMPPASQLGGPSIIRSPAAYKTAVL